MICAKVLIAILISLVLQCNSIRVSRIISNMRNTKLATASLLLSFSTLINQVDASSISLKQYNNERYHTTISYPGNWDEKSGALSGERSVVAFTDPKDPSTSISLVFTPIPADYNRINSFGGKDNLRLNLLPAGDEISTKVINEYIKGDSYFLEYVVAAPNNPVRHVQSVFALRPQESVVGLTMQTEEDNYANVKNTLDEILPTFRVDIE